MGAEDGLFPRPGAYYQAQDIGAVNKHSLRREAESCLDGDSTVMKRSTTGRVGWVRRSADLIPERAHHLAKSEPGFMNTSIHRLATW
jgi:hypothetical protein